MVTGPQSGIPAENNGVLCGYEINLDQNIG